MSQEDLIGAYQKGEIDSWTCVRRLLKKGVPVAAALSLLLAAPVAQADDDSDDCGVTPNLVAGTLDTLDDGDDDCDDDDDDDDDDGGINIPPVPPNINVP